MVKKGMKIESDPESGFIWIDGKNILELDQFERIYGQVSSGDHLAQIEKLAV